MYPPWRELRKYSLMGSHLSLFLFYIHPYKHFFDFKFSKEIGLFFRSQFCIPRGESQCNAPPRGPIWVLLIFISSLTNTFLISNSLMKSAFFSPSIFYPPWRELLKCSPMGSHLSLFLFYILYYKHFFDFKFCNEIGLFLHAEFFIVTDGRDTIWLFGVKNHVFWRFLKK